MHSMTKHFMLNDQAIAANYILDNGRKKDLIIDLDVHQVMGQHQYLKIIICIHIIISWKIIIHLEKKK